MQKARFTDCIPTIGSLASKHLSSLRVITKDFNGDVSKIEGDSGRQAADKHSKNRCIKSQYP